MATASSIIAGRALVLIEAIDKTGKVFPKVMARFRNFNARVMALNAAGITGFNAYGAALKSVVGPLMNMQKNWAALGQFVSYTLNTMASKMRMIGQSAMHLGFQLTLAAGLMAIPFRQSLEEAAKLNTELLKTKAAANLTTQEMEQLEGVVKRMSRGRPGQPSTFLPEEIATVARELARANIEDVVDMETAIMPILNLSRGQDFDPMDTAKLLTQATTAFQTGVEGFEESADMFAAAADASLGDMEDFAAAWGYAVNQVVQTNTKQSEALASLSLLTFSGLGGSKGGTSLNRFLGSISEKAEDINEAFGVDTFDATGALKNPLDIVMELAKVLKALPDEEKLPKLTRIFDQRGVRALLSLVDNMHLYNDILHKIENPMQTAADKARILDEGFEGSMRRIKRSAALVKIAFGEAFQEPLRRVADWIEKLTDKTVPWIEANHQVVREVGFLIIKIGAAGIALMTFSVAVKATTFALSGLATMAKVAGDAIENLIELQIASSFRGALLILTKTTVIIGLIAATLYGLAQIIKRDLASAWTVFGKEVSAGYAKIKRDFIDLITEVNKLWQIFRPMIKAILQAGLWTFVIVWVAGFRIVVRLTRIILSNLEMITRTLRRVVQLNLLPIKTLILGIKAGIWALLLPLKTTAVIWKTVWWAVKRIFGTLFKIVITIRKFLYATAPIVIAFKILWAVVSGIYEKVVAFWSALKGFASLVFPISEAFSLIAQIFAEILNIAESLWFLFTGGKAFNELIEGLYNVAQTIHDLIIQPLEDMLDYLKMVSDFLDKFTGREKGNPAERLNLLKQKEKLEEVLSRPTVTSASITKFHGTSAAREEIFQRGQQARTISLLDSIDQRLKAIDEYQKRKKLGFGGI